MRFAVAASAALLLLFVAAGAFAAKPKILVAPVRVEGAAGGASAAEWGRILSRRLSDRFQVLSPETVPPDLDSALRLARGARADYLVEATYTRIGNGSTLDLIVMDTSGRVFDTITSDASIDPGREGGPGGDTARLSLSGTSRLVARILGATDGTAGGGKGKLRPPEGILERSSPRQGKVEGAAFDPGGKGGKGAGWFVSSGGKVLFHPLKDGDLAPPVDVFASRDNVSPTRLAAGDTDGDGDAELFLGIGSGPEGTLTALRKAGKSWRAVGKPLPGTPVRLAGTQASPVLLALFPRGASSVPGLLRFPGKGREPAREDRPSAASPPGEPGEPVLLLEAGGTLSRAYVDDLGRVTVGGMAGSPPRSAPIRLPAGRTLLIPADLDGDGRDELLAAVETERPGAIFENLSVPSGSEISCYSIDPSGAPRLAWKVPLPYPGIVAGAAERDGRIQFLVRDPVVRPGEGERWRSLRMR